MGHKSAIEQAALQALGRLKTIYQTKAALYGRSETWWRRMNFTIAIFLGVCPVLVSITKLLPEEYQQWSAFMIAIVNIIIVVCQLKLEIGERIADASMGSKGYSKLVSDIELFLTSASCDPDGANASSVLTEVRSQLGQLEATMKFPIAERRPKTKGSEGLVSSGIPQFSQVFESVAPIPGRQSGEGMLAAAGAAAAGAGAAGAAQALASSFPLKNGEMMPQESPLLAAAGAAQALASSYPNMEAFAEDAQAMASKQAQMGSQALLAQGMTFADDAQATASKQAQMGSQALLAQGIGALGQMCENGTGFLQPGSVPGSLQPSPEAGRGPPPPPPPPKDSGDEDV